jgi:hypothetical protein
MAAQMSARLVKLLLPGGRIDALNRQDPGPESAAGRGRTETRAGAEVAGIADFEADTEQQKGG